MNNNDNLTRIAIYYDGSYFKKVSDYYKYHHDRQTRLSLAGIQKFICHKVAEFQEMDVRRCKVSEAHYFRGRLSSKMAVEQNALEFERKFDEVLMRAGIQPHYLPLNERDMTEKGVDIWFALEAYDLAVHKGVDVICLIACDGDYVPLVQKLNALGVIVVLLAWDIADTNTRTSQALIDRCHFPIMMMDEVDSRTSQKSSIIDGLFLGG